MYLHLKNLLDKGAIDIIRQELVNASFVDGSATASGAAKKVKHNLQLPREDKVSIKINTLLETALQQNFLFREATLPKAVLPFMVSSYEPGMEYGWHVDNPLMYAHPVQLRADMSMTVYLNDPTEYEGGELEIEDTPSAHRFKLNAGDAMIYSTTRLHRVRPVTRGQRIVAVTWIQSLVKDAARRELLFMLTRLKETLDGSSQGSEAHLLSQQAHSNLLRMWATI